MRLEHGFGLTAFVVSRMISCGIQQFAFRCSGAVSVNAKDLVEAETGEKLLAARAAMHNMEMPVPQFLQPKRYTGHRSHKSGVHHRAVFEIDDELAIAAVYH